MTANRFFLYLDILGFTALVRQQNGKIIEDLYEVIAGLNANKHDAFKVVVFSDTVVVYNVNGGDTPEDASHLVMFLCEFAKDLMHRLTGRNIYFRAVIVYGDFTHYELNDIPCFFGNALVDAYNSEKELKAIGLFIHKSISHHSDIFKFRSFNDNYNFVYVTQSLSEIDAWGADGFPIPAELLDDTDACWEIYPEAAHVARMLEGSVDPTYPMSVREKYAASWDMYKRQYPNLTAQLEAANGDVRSISPRSDWQQVIDRHPESHAFAVKKRVQF